MGVNNSCHLVIPFIINLTTGTINDVIVTEESNFIFSPLASDGFLTYRIENVWIFKL